MKLQKFIYSKVKRKYNNANNIAYDSDSEIVGKTPSSLDDDSMHLGIDKVAPIRDARKKNPSESFLNDDDDQFLSESSSTEFDDAELEQTSFILDDNKTTPTPTPFLQANNSSSNNNINNKIPDKSPPQETRSLNSAINVPKVSMEISRKDFESQSESKLDQQSPILVTSSIELSKPEAQKKIDVENKKNKVKNEKLLKESMNKEKAEQPYVVKIDNERKLEEEKSSKKELLKVKDEDVLEEKSNLLKKKKIEALKSTTTSENGEEKGSVKEMRHGSGGDSRTSLISAKLVTNDKKLKERRCLEDKLLERYPFTFAIIYCEVLIIFSVAKIVLQIVLLFHKAPLNYLSCGLWSGPVGLIVVAFVVYTGKGF